MSEYKVTVVFTRSHGDDDEIIRDKYPDETFAEGAKRQLRDELQLCCDDLGLPAGSFQIVKVEDNG